MTFCDAALAICLTPVWLLANPAAQASTNDILIGLDEKVASDANGHGPSALAPGTVPGTMRRVAMRC
jgi:hypothetical protein